MPLLLWFVSSAANSVIGTKARQQERFCRQCFSCTTWQRGRIIGDMQKKCTVAKMERGHVKLYDERGIYMGNIVVNNAVAVDVSAGGVAIQTGDGRTRLYSPTGQYIRTI